MEIRWKDKKVNVTSSIIHFYIVWDFETYYYFMYSKKF